MYKFYKKLSKVKKVIFWIFYLLFFILAGAFLGLFLGAMSVTFIPQCCTEIGCHSCLQFAGVRGYEASGLIGFIAGSILSPIIATILFVFVNKKKN